MRMTFRKWKDFVRQMAGGRAASEVNRFKPSAFVE
jgi:hypothetical protein